MALQHMMDVPCLLAPVRDNAVKHVAYVRCIDEKASSSRYCFRMMGGHSIPSTFSEGRHFINAIARASKYCSDITSGGVNKKGRGELSEKNSSDSETEYDDEDDFMDRDKRLEWRTKIREVLSKMPDTEEELDPAEKQKKMQKLLADYPLVVEEDDPDWPDDADGWGFNFDQFFNKITIKNEKNEDDEDYDSDDEIVWQDDNYIRPIKDVKTADWEVTLFKDISPLIVLVHNRYKRPKENERMRDELEKAIHIIWNCRLPSPRCIAVDAVVELDLISALQVSVFPELIFTKAGKILYREKAIRSADELSKIMAFFYYGAAKPSFLNVNEDSQEAVPSVALDTAN